MNQIIENIFNSIVAGDQETVVSSVNEALSIGIEVDEILHEGLIPPMLKVGDLFETGEIFVPEMLVSARAMKSGLKILEPLLIDSSIEPAGKVVIGTVKGDLHDIGKNLVSFMLEGAGFEIIDLGVDVSPDVFVEAVTGDKADILALSALLTTTLLNIENTIKALIESGEREKIKVIIGGAPVTNEYAVSIGADGYASNAGQVVSLVKRILACSLNFVN